jgi:hypothetical protein
MVTFALGTTAPDASVTVPVIPVDAWACNFTAEVRKTANINARIAACSKLLCRRVHNAFTWRYFLIYFATPLNSETLK